MCGIAGLVLPDGLAQERVLAAMAETMTHRGPDDSGLLTDGRVGLAMRRLSIIDLAEGHQPIHNEDGSSSIVYNGEIYNYRQLRQSLRSRGHHFKTHSDTEVILHQYEELGEDCPTVLNGMFGFAIWDRRKRTIFLARDRLGIKPLYYYWDGRTFVFGSELKAILASGLVQKEVRRESVWHFLSFRYVPGPETIWRNVFKLQPGHRLTFSLDDGQLRIDRYWRLKYQDDYDPEDREDDLERFGSLFQAAVDRRLVADVPVGILLSGGLDSSAVAAAAKEVHNARLSTFSIGFEGHDDLNESRHARVAANHLGADHHEIFLRVEDCLAFLHDYSWFSDDLGADPASIPLYIVSGLARKHVKVVLGGEGADEVLGGYDLDRAVHRWQRIACAQRMPRFLRQAAKRWAHAVGNSRLQHALNTIDTPLAELNETSVSHMTNYFAGDRKQSVWRGEPFGESMDRVRLQYRRASSRDPLHQLLEVYCQDWLVEDLLMKADRMTMANSLELRVPFLDHELVEWLASRPPSLKVGRLDGSLVTKRILREWATSRIPSSILKRPKMGFPNPIFRWLREGEMGRMAVDTLDREGAAVYDWVDSKVVRPWIQDGSWRESPTGASELWLLLTLELWAQEWL